MLLPALSASQDEDHIRSHECIFDLKRIVLAQWKPLVAPQGSTLDIILVIGSDRADAACRSNCLEILIMLFDGLLEADTA